MTCASTVRSVTNSRAAIARFDIPFGHEPQDFSFPVGEPGQRIGPAAPAQEAGDDRRVDDRFAVHDPPEGVDHRGHVKHPFLKQVPGPRCR